MRNCTRVATWHAAPIVIGRHVEHQAVVVEERPGADADTRVPYSQWNGGRMWTPSPTSPISSRRSAVALVLLGVQPCAL